MKLVFWHKPNCATSKKVLGMIRDAGHEPEIFDYIATPPTRAKLLNVLKMLKMLPRELLRRQNTPFDELGLGDDKWSD